MQRREAEREHEVSLSSCPRVSANKHMQIGVGVLKLHQLDPWRKAADIAPVARRASGRRFGQYRARAQQQSLGGGVIQRAKAHGGADQTDCEAMQLDRDRRCFIESRRHRQQRQRHRLVAVRVARTHSRRVLARQPAALDGCAKQQHPPTTAT